MHRLRRESHVSGGMGLWNVTTHSKQWRWSLCEDSTTLVLYRYQFIIAQSASRERVHLVLQSFTVFCVWWCLVLYWKDFERLCPAQSGIDDLSTRTDFAVMVVCAILHPLLPIVWPVHVPPSLADQSVLQPRCCREYQIRSGGSQRHRHVLRAGVWSGVSITQARSAEHALWKYVSWTLDLFAYWIGVAKMFACVLKSTGIFATGRLQTVDLSLYCVAIQCGVNYDNKMYLSNYN